jgi:ribose-phosphate pyrophosphokinase
MDKFKLFTIGGLGSFTVPDIGKFPGGEIRVKLPVFLGLPEMVRIEALLFNSDDVMTLVMLTDALRERGVEKIRLTMPYIPYARQDRVCNDGEAFSVRAFARIINALQFSSVVVWDAHSDVSVALLDRCINIPRYQLMVSNQAIANWINTNLASETPMYLVSPDAGAVKKSYDIAKAFPQFKGIIFAEKVRDPATGKILRTDIPKLPDDIAEAALLVCDDIVDGGRTFTELANWFTDVSGRPQPKEMNLYVTHGIFSQGMEVLLKHFDNVWSETNFEYKKS